MAKASNVIEFFYYSIKGAFGWDSIDQSHSQWDILDLSKRADWYVYYDAYILVGCPEFPLSQKDRNILNNQYIKLMTINNPLKKEVKQRRVINA